MIKEKIATQFETRYVADDGKVWQTERQCQQYEELLNDPSPLKALSFFDHKGEPIDVFALHEIPYFAYLVLDHEIQRYDEVVVKAILGASYGAEQSYALPTREGIWYNDWSQAYSGGYGFNGWREQSSIQTLENRIKAYQEEIKFLKKITKTS